MECLKPLLLYEVVSKDFVRWYYMYLFGLGFLLLNVILMSNKTYHKHHYYNFNNSQ